MSDIDSIGSIEGKTTIAPHVLLTIANLAATGVNGVFRLSPVPSSSVNRLLKRSHSADGVIVEINDDIVDIDIFVVLQSDVNVRDVSRNIQRAVARTISEMVGLQVGRVNIHIEDINYPAEEETTPL